jgi:hypothetical protein
MRLLFLVMLISLSVGCTTRADKAGNKDYDKPKSSGR